MNQPRTLGGQIAPGTYQPATAGYGLPQGATIPGSHVGTGGYVTSTAQSFTPQPSTVGAPVNLGPSTQYYGPGPVPQQGQPAQPGQPAQQGQPGQPAQPPAKVSDQRPPIPNPPVVLPPSHPMARNLTGTLVVKPQMGQYDKNYDVVGAMDPYCIVQVGASPQQTSVAKGQGQQCRWEDALHFPIKGEQFLFIDSLDYDVIGSHDYIGRAQLDLTQILARGHFADWVPLMDNAQKKVGQVYVSVDMVTSGVNPNMPAGYAPRQGPITNVLQHSFGDWGRAHPGYVYQPGTLNSQVFGQQSNFGGASQYGQQYHVPGTQIGGYSHVLGPQGHVQNGYGVGVSPQNGQFGSPARF